MDYSLRAVFGLDATGLKTGLKQVRAEVNNLVTRWGKWVALAGAAAFVKLSRDALQFATNIDNTSKKLGLSTDFLQQFSYAAEQFGIRQDTANMALQRFSRRLAEAQQGSGELLPILRQYNIQLTDSGGRARAAEAVLGDLAETMKATSNPTERLRMAFKAFDSEGVGLVSVLQNGREGMAQFAEEATKAGAVMTENTVVSLAKAQQAIENFRRQATVAVGEIIVNFKSEEGIRLLWLRFRGMVDDFGAMLADALVDGGKIGFAIFKGMFMGVTNQFRDGLVSVVQGIASLINRVLPERFEINVGNLEEFKSSGKSIGQEINYAIGRTEPSALRATLREANDKLIAEQKAVVDALNRVDIKPQADAIVVAGDKAAVQIDKAADKIEEGGVQAGAAIAKGGEKAAALVREAVESINGAVAGIRGGAVFNTASDAALKEIVRRNRQQAQNVVNPALTSGFRYNTGESARLRLEADNAERELQMRQGVRSAFAAGGEQGVFRAFSQTDPTILTRMIDQFARNLTEAEQQTQLLSTIERGLVARGIIGRI